MHGKYEGSRCEISLTFINDCHWNYIWRYDQIQKIDGDFAVISLLFLFNLSHILGVRSTLS